MKKVLTIIGGCGHIGIPLGLAYADCGHKVFLLDIDQSRVDSINSGLLPYKEKKAHEILQRVVGKTLFATTNSTVLSESDVVIFATRTIDSGAQKSANDESLLRIVRHYLHLLTSRHLIILRSTIGPGTTKIVEQILMAKMEMPKLAFCPERILQGDGIDELGVLPQIVSAIDEQTENEAADFFMTIAPQILRLKPAEAEMTKLFSNSWRYLEFALANQFYMLAENQGLDFYKIFEALRLNYPRANGFAQPGLTAGPCLLKDTRQLSSHYHEHFSMGDAGIRINESLPGFLIEQLEKKMGALKGKKIAILGMTFKANSDDVRDSLSLKLKMLLEYKNVNVICSDTNLPETTPLQSALKMADGIILGVPHNEYRSLSIHQPFVDCWGVIKKETSSFNFDSQTQRSKEDPIASI